MGNPELGWSETKQWREHRPHRAQEIDLEARGRAFASQRLAAEARQVEQWHTARQSGRRSRVTIPLLISAAFFMLLLAAHFVAI